jgi:Tfp pilus assembly protein PilX
MMIKMLIKRAAAALRADEMQARNRADACSSNSFFSPSVHVTCGSAPNNTFSPSDVKASAVKLHQCSTTWKLGQWGDLNEAPEKSALWQVRGRSCRYPVLRDL